MFPLISISNTPALSWGISRYVELTVDTGAASVVGVALGAVLSDGVIVGAIVGISVGAGVGSVADVSVGIKVGSVVGASIGVGVGIGVATGVSVGRTIPTSPYTFLFTNQSQHNCPFHSTLRLRLNFQQHI